MDAGSLAESKPLSLIRVLLALSLWGLLTTSVLAASLTILAPSCTSLLHGHNLYIHEGTRPTNNLS